ncbi:methyltransferase domain-containing protein [Limibacillus sp. MBR-115]|jgi:trans-aconitate methyltransferase|uniref:methyltransferase domain-containing protein n=1 Tax=Limibacillus sp. MBR-115 TaxID=3156465 RepID=UPI003392D936
MPAKNGQTQHWDPARYIRNAGFVAKLGEPLIELLVPKAGERVLDLGCGDGALTEKLVECGLDVVAVDASTDQIAAAKARGLDARVVNGQELAFQSEFDAVFTNAALHWMLDPDAVLDGVARALKPGGRFVGEMGGGDNVKTIKDALVAALDRRNFDGESANPWYFPQPQEYLDKLQSHGFKVSYIELIPRPTPLPGDLSAWLETFGENFIRLLPDAEQPAYIAEVVEALRPQLCDADGNWTADYVRLRFKAELR